MYGMTQEQVLHAKRVNSKPEYVVADYMDRRRDYSVDIALEDTADYWGVDINGLAVYLSSRVLEDREALKYWLPFLWMRSDEA